MSILDDAAAAVDGPRQQDYGHPRENWGRTAALWSVILGTEVTPEQALLCMAAVKIARHVHAPKRDNLVDLAGYARVIELLGEADGFSEALDECHRVWAEDPDPEGEESAPAATGSGDDACESCGHIRDIHLGGCYHISVGMDPFEHCGCEGFAGPPESGPVIRQLRQAIRGE